MTRRLFGTITSATLLMVRAGRYKWRVVQYKDRMSVLFGTNTSATLLMVRAGRYKWRVVQYKDRMSVLCGTNTSATLLMVRAGRYKWRVVQYKDAVSLAHSHHKDETVELLCPAVVTSSVSGRFQLYKGPVPVGLNV